MLETAHAFTRRMRRRFSVASIVEELVGDARHCLRLLRGAPGFTAAAITTLALGIGANVTIFGVLSAVLINRLPYPHPDQLVAAYEISRQGERRSVSPLDLRDWKANATALSQLEAYGVGTAAWADDNDLARVRTAPVTPGFFAVFGIQPLAGAVTSEVGSDVVISERLWKGRLGGANILGQFVSIDGARYRVGAIMPTKLDFPHGTDVWVPIDLAKTYAGVKRGARVVRVVGRVRDGVALHTAQAELELIAQRLAREYPSADRGVHAQLVPLRDTLTANARPTLLLLGAMVSLVFLIACSNVAGLLLARSAARTREFALRAALGASRFRLTRQLLVECTLLACGGAAAGVSVALWLTRAVLSSASLASVALTPMTDLTTMLSYTVLLMLVCAGLVGIAPALALSEGQLIGRISEGGGRASARTTGGIIVVAETAMAAFLLAGAVLVTRSLTRLQREPLGFNPMGLYTVSAKPPATLTGNSRFSFEAATLDAIRAIPGVSNAAIANVTPFAGGRFSDALPLYIEGRSSGGENAPSAIWRVVSDQYFSALGRPIGVGRDFAASDRRGACVVVVNDAAMRTWWRGESPLGARVAMPLLTGDTVSANARAPSWCTVIGVAGDVREESFAAEPEPTIFFPLNPALADIIPDILVRSTLPLNTLQASVSTAVASVNSHVPAEVHAMQALLATSTATPRLRAQLIAAFAVLAALLVAVGVYGVTARLVQQQFVEIGIRMALGARPVNVLLPMLMRIGSYSLGGTALGLPAAMVAAHFARTFLYQIAPTDPTSFFVVAVGVLTLTALAIVVPAATVVRVDPVLALRGR